MNEEESKRITEEQIAQIINDYYFFYPYFYTFQHDIYFLVKELLANQQGVRDIIPREGNRLKKVESVKDSLIRKNKASLLELPDIAGIRVVCYSRIDKRNVI